MDDMVGRGGFEVPSDEMMDLPCPKCTVVTQAHNFGFGIILVALPGFVWVEIEAPTVEVDGGARHCGSRGPSS